MVGGPFVGELPDFFDAHLFLSGPENLYRVSAAIMSREFKAAANFQHGQNVGDRKVFLKPKPR